MIFIIALNLDKFKGYNCKTDAALSLDDLMDLLNSVDHENVISTQQVLSDSALEALLDRNFATSTSTKRKSDEIMKDQITRHCEFFKVVEEQQDCNNTLQVVNSENAVDGISPATK